MQMWIARPWAAWVALRKESVDRNSIFLKRFGFLAVALRKESVDRNKPGFTFCLAAGNVALRKESVDRNPSFAKYAYGRISRSPQGERG